MGAKDFFIGGDLNIELKLEGLNSLDWYGLCGPEYRRRGEDVVKYAGHND